MLSDADLCIVGEEVTHADIGLTPNQKVKCPLVKASVRKHTTVGNAFDFGTIDVFCVVVVCSMLQCIVVI